uniref:Uncharacterized protein n=1 Tax=Anguilla anguilla TaxID=7936 RepID=A0A0E9PRR1_ANGAN
MAAQRTVRLCKESVGIFVSVGGGGAVIFTHTLQNLIQQSLVVWAQRRKDRFQCGTSGFRLFFPCIQVDLDVISRPRGAT